MNDTVLLSKGKLKTVEYIFCFDKKSLPSDRKVMLNCNGGSFYYKESRRRNYSYLQAKSDSQHLLVCNLLSLKISLEERKKERAKSIQSCEFRRRFNYLAIKIKGARETKKLEKIRRVIFSSPKDEYWKAEWHSTDSNKVFQM